MGKPRPSVIKRQREQVKRERQQLKTAKRLDRKNNAALAASPDESAPAE